MKVDTQAFLEDLGVKHVQRRGREIWYSCPFDGHSHADTTPSASMSTETGGFHCFGCGRSGNQVVFLAELEGVSTLVAMRMIRQHFDPQSYVEPDDLEARVRQLLEIAPAGEFTTLSELPEHHLEERRIDWALAEKTYSITASELDPISYMFDRGFTADELEAWEFGYDEISGMACFPYRHHDGMLLGLKGRAWWPGAKPKYRFLGDKYGEDKYGFPTFDVHLCVFGAHDIVPSQERLIVCEGEFNAIFARRCFDRVIGISGQFITVEQARIIAQLAGEAVLVFDNPERAADAANMLLPFMPVLVAQEHDTDPADMEESQFVHLVRNSVSSILLCL